MAPGTVIVVRFTEQYYMQLNWNNQLFYFFKQDSKRKPTLGLYECLSRNTPTDDRAMLESMYTGYGTGINPTAILKTCCVWMLELGNRLLNESSLCSALVGRSLRSRLQCAPCFCTI